MMLNGVCVIGLRKPSFKVKLTCAGGTCSSKYTKLRLVSLDTFPINKRKGKWVQPIFGIKVYPLQFLDFSSI